MRPAVAAVIPTYRPPADELTALLSSLENAGVPTLVADDASPCTSDALLASVARRGVPVARFRRNAGIARSLNAGLVFGAELGARWLLTVDQDSSLPDGYLPALPMAASAAEDALGRDGVGAVAAGAIDDASGALGYPTRTVAGLTVTEEVIQTGTLWAVEPLRAVGGFDERLGIDAVDAAACLALRAAGLRIVVAPDVAIAHRIGLGRQVSLFGRKVMSTGHSPERRESILRNRLRLFPAEFSQSPTHALRTIRRVGVQTSLAVTVEEDRWSKAKASIRGAWPRRAR